MKYWSPARRESKKYLMKIPKIYHFITPKERRMSDFPPLHHSSTPERDKIQTRPAPKGD